jgi:glyoxylase-like metal-dependent hydrolase (beta-lactamase superfamily II)
MTNSEFLTGAKFQIGSIPITIVNDGTFMYDGGAIFGVVPRVMWERAVQNEIDSQHRITQGLNCVLLRSNGKNILLDTGVGGKPGDRDVASPIEQGNLIRSIAQQGLSPSDIDVVVNTHLHFDHCGWNTSVSSNNEELVATFPNATYYISEKEWNDALNPNERTRATYLEKNLKPIMDHIKLFDDEIKITDEVVVSPTPGHTEGHSAVFMRSGQEWGVYVGDMIQHHAQLERTAWVSGLDVLPLVSMETKKKLAAECIESEALIIFSHGTYPGVGKLTLTDEGFRKWEKEAPHVAGSSPHTH